MQTLNEVIRNLPEKQRARVNAKAKRLITAETLRQLRTFANKTQQDVAAASGISQYNVSRLEKREDMLLSTLEAYVGGLGGYLRLVAEIPGVDSVELDLFRSSTQRKRSRLEKRRNSP
jgi:transcriptional regulator with XRE-family HTH domain